MTLVELLVVAAIMVLLLAVSVPLFKPMLESRRTSNAAQVLAGVFQQARAKSVQEGRSYGVRLVPFENAPTTAIQLRFQKESALDFVNPPDVRVRVENGNIIPYYFSEDATGEWKWRVVGWDANIPNVQLARDHFQRGYAVQFNRLGRFFTMDGNFKLLPPYNNLNLPEYVIDNEAMEYHVSCLTSTPLWLPPVVMPRGTIVDLVFSGGEMVDFGDVPVYFSTWDEVIVMFSPVGHVDLLYVNGNPYKVNEMLFFCVGDWDRQIDAMGNPLAEDKKSNLEVPATYWVTLHPKTGGVRITENAPIQPTSGTIEERLRDARRFAREHFFNVGGF